MRKAIHFILFCPREKRRVLLAEFVGWFEVGGIALVLALLFFMLRRQTDDNQPYVSGKTAMIQSLEKIRAQGISIEPLAVWQTKLRKEDLTDNEFGRIFRTPHGAKQIAPSSADDLNSTQLYGFEMLPGSRQRAGALDKPNPLFVHGLKSDAPAPPVFVREDVQSGNSQPFFYSPASTHTAPRDARSRPGGGMSR